MWLIEYRHSLRADEGGVRFVENHEATFGAGQHLEAAGYVITNVAPTSKVRMADPEQPPPASAR
jgi:hypothetical protein